VVLNTKILDLVVSNPRGLKPGPKQCTPGKFGKVILYVLDSNSRGRIEFDGILRVQKE